MAVGNINRGAMFAPKSAMSLYAALLACAALPIASAHNHDSSHIEEGQMISADPIDTTLWIHIFVQMAAWGVIFPLGMVLGIVRSRWHVPVQVAGTALAILGYALGHMHGGREFLHSNVHSMFATPLSLLLFVQILLGIYLKLHMEKGVHGKIRRFVVMGHGVLGKAMPVLSWTQMIFGGFTALGFCADNEPPGDHLGQCLAHFIMGSSFIVYGILLLLVLLVGQVWIKRTGRSQDFFDSAMIAAWGCVNTFTEHRWGTAWVRNDWQHTTMGIIWWSAGLVGVWLSKDRDGRPQRNLIPGFVLLITGWAMSSHPQTLMISAETHKMFGYTLMAAGLTRMIEISFVLKDRHGMSVDGRVTHSFQYVPIFLLIASGFLFMAATEEQMDLVDSSDMDHVAYILILYSLAMLLFLWVNMLITTYDRNVGPALPNKEAANGRLGPRLNGNVPVRDAEEFELEGLMSDDEGDHADHVRRRVQDDEDDSLNSPSTVGKNNDRVVQ
ncbi:Uu.00g050890.m01.CDS01 [Anthostomella pinea]|uniref:Uu.00g050890.m01.CDS01 n=1 Tax=Anthostomella pinea TaxID=933095 RepID=A0AAI8VSR7_9PEZI|nr:Uu.00g050890.m01.CDS01 [Anthostomella pinea]